MIERSGSVSSVLSSGSRSSSRHTSISGQNVFSLRNKVIVCVVDCTYIIIVYQFIIKGKSKADNLLKKQECMSYLSFST